MSADVFTPLVGALGVETARPVLTLSDAALREALHDNYLVVFREQSLDVAGLAAVGEKLGTLADYPFAAPLAEHPFVYPVVKEADERFNFGGMWHTDTAYLAEPPAYTALHALEVPEQGGDTLYADMVQAFRALSAGLQATLRSLVGVNSSANVHGSGGAYTTVAGDDGVAKAAAADAASQMSALHPAVLRHPVTGREALYVSRAHTERFEAMTGPESRPLIDYLQDFATRPDFCTRLSWRPGTLAVWDNRSVQHYPLNDYTGHRRAMRRVIVHAPR